MVRHFPVLHFQVVHFQSIFFTFDVRRLLDSLYEAILIGTRNLTTNPTFQNLANYPPGKNKRTEKPW